MGILRQLAAGLAERGQVLSALDSSLAMLVDERVYAGSSLVVVVGLVVEDVDRALVRHAANHAFGVNVFGGQVEVLSGDGGDGMDGQRLDAAWVGQHGDCGQTRLARFFVVVPQLRILLVKRRAVVEPVKARVTSVQVQHGAVYKERERTATR